MVLDISSELSSICALQKTPEEVLRLQWNKYVIHVGKGLKEVLLIILNVYIKRMMLLCLVALSQVLRNRLGQK